jgi:Ca2+/H+ antiporter
MLQEGHFVPSRVRRILIERRYEVLSFLALAALAAVCFFVSIPKEITETSTLAGLRTHWQRDLWGRLGTALAASATTALLYIVFTLYDVKRHRRVVWRLVGDKKSDRQ